MTTSKESIASGAGDSRYMSIATAFCADFAQLFTDLPPAVNRVLKTAMLFAVEVHLGFMPLLAF